MARYEKRRCIIDIDGARDGERAMALRCMSKSERSLTMSEARSYITTQQMASGAQRSCSCCAW